jgi:hypothetical protein
MSIGGGADWEQRGASNGVQRVRTGLAFADRLGVTCWSSCLCWSKRWGPFVEEEALNGAERTSTAVYRSWQSGLSTVRR